MDMNTIQAVVPTADPDQWREGDAWLAGGTVLFSYGSCVLTRLLDISTAGWPAITVTDDGIELAASATIAELYELPELCAAGGAGGRPAANGGGDGDGGRPAANGGGGLQAAHGGPHCDALLLRWPALELVRQCCDSFVASFKIWNMSTVGGNICTALPAGPMTSLCASLDGMATILTPGGGRRVVPVAELVTGDGRTALRTGELLRSIFLPAAALASRVAFRRLSLTNLGRSGALLIGRRDTDGTLLITVTAATKRPVQLRFGAQADLTPATGLPVGAFPDRPDADAVRAGGAAVVVCPDRPDAAALRSALDAAIPVDLYHDDIHGLPQWRRDMTYRLAEEIRAELLDGPDGCHRRTGAPVQLPVQSPLGSPAGPSAGRGA